MAARCSDPAAVVALPDLDTIYKVPLVLHEAGLDSNICELLNIWTREPDVSCWRAIVASPAHTRQRVPAALEGKHLDLATPYNRPTAALPPDGEVGLRVDSACGLGGGVLACAAVAALLGDAVVDGTRVVAGAVSPRRASGRLRLAETRDI